MISFINPDLIALRESYALANQSRTNYKLFNDKIKKAVSVDLPIVRGYSAASLMINANFEMNPFTKLKYFNDGKAMLESAIEEYQSNTELHFIRYTIQERCPRILGYNGQLSQDKLFLIRQISDPNKMNDDDLSERIKSDLLKSEAVTDQEKAKIKQIKRRN